MTSSVERANKIRAYASERPRIPKALLVVAFCEQEGIECRVSARAIETGMGRMPYWAQGVENFLDFALACTAAINEQEASNDDGRLD